MVTLELTNREAEDVFYATSLLYHEYVDELGSDFNSVIEKHNNEVDELRIKIKQQLEEQA